MSLCLGWKTMKNCGRNDQVIAPGSSSLASCPDISWFYLTTIAVFGAALLMKKK